MDFDVSLTVESLPKLLKGVRLTLELVGLSVAIGFFIAVPTAILRASRLKAARAVSGGYVFFFRGTPLMVQIFLIYYGFGSVEWIRESVLWVVFRQPYWCALIAFTLNTAAYSAEILRGAIQAVPHGEIEAAKAIAMTRTQTLLRIVLPRAFRIGLPAYGNEIVFMIKGSALASTITLMDLTGVARVLVSQTYKPVEIFLAAGLLYLAIVYAAALALRLVEKKLSISPPRLPVRTEDGGAA